MAASAGKRRAYILATPHKAEASAALADLRDFAAGHCTVVGHATTVDGRNAVRAAAERIIVLGGDGTLIGVARSLATDQIPLIGVNVGKLGFLAEFSVDELKKCFDQALADDTLISRRMVLSVEVKNGEKSRAVAASGDKSLAINDCVIRAGDPFRVIRLGILINGQHLTDVAGDGLIVCTPSGSTAHNLSAGGPIVQSGIPAMVLTPLCPHSLTHRPLVIESDSVIEVIARSVNPGTTAIIDGQTSCPLSPGDRVIIRRFDTDFLLVHNPLYPKWHNLTTKLHWGQGPDYE